MQYVLVFLFQEEDGIRDLVRSRGMGEVYKIFFFQAEDGIRDFCLSRGLGDVYRGQLPVAAIGIPPGETRPTGQQVRFDSIGQATKAPGRPRLLYTSDAADELPCVDLGGRRILKKKKKTTTTTQHKQQPQQTRI